MSVEQKWYFAQNSSPSNEMADKLIDSKFGIEKLSSFVREIIQNSLDAHDDLSDKPVVVKFSSKDFKLEQIPGGARLREILEKCYSADTLNPQTEKMYKKGLEVLNSDCITCLKISDENTLGVEPGLDKAWGAFVYDEGVSRKVRPGSAGSHGVGKKAPFIISGVHTVFYATNYNGTRLFEGKTSLINWNEDGIDYDYKGWYGNVNLDEPDRRKKVLPIEYDYSIDGVDEFFIRKEERGTDVIIVDTSSIGKISDAKAKIIIAILENFFVAIRTKKLECDVFGERITSENIDGILNKYYLNQHIKFGRIEEAGTVYEGNLKDYYRVFKSGVPQAKIDMIVNGINYGYAEIYFDVSNEKNKKYYCIVREHGMKIRDYKVDTDQPFTAVVVIKNHENDTLKPEERINERLSSRENAAHDDFIINDDQVPCDPITKELIEYMYSEIKRYIQKMTELKVDNQSFLDSLSEMLYIPGSTSKGSAKKNKPKLKKKKKQLLQPGKGKEDPNGQAGKSAGDGTGKGNGGRGTKKKVKVDGETNAYLYKNFSQEPIFIKTSNSYLVKFIPNNSGNALINVSPVSIDGGECIINGIVESAYQDGRKLKVTGNYIREVELKKGQLVTANINLQSGLDYVLDCDVLVEAINED